MIFIVDLNRDLNRNNPATLDGSDGNMVEMLTEKCAHVGLEGQVFIFTNIQTLKSKWC